MKRNVVKHNLLIKFQQVFDTFWNDPEFGLKGDDNLITMICANLTFE